MGFIFNDDKSKSTMHVPKTVTRNIGTATQNITITPNNLGLDSDTNIIRWEVIAMYYGDKLQGDTFTNVNPEWTYNDTDNQIEVEIDLSLGSTVNIVLMYVESRRG